MPKEIRVAAAGIIQVVGSEEIYTLAGLRDRRAQLRTAKDRIIDQRDKMFADRLAVVQAQIDDVNELIASAKTLGQELP